MKHTDTEKKLTTSQLLSIIKKSGQFSEVTNIWQDEMETPVFCHYLYETMEKHKLTAKDIIQRSGIERSYFYHLLSGFKTPGRNIVLRICLCMEATLTETSQLLRLAGHGSLTQKYAVMQRSSLPSRKNTPCSRLTNCCSVFRKRRSTGNPTTESGGTAYERSHPA